MLMICGVALGGLAVWMLTLCRRWRSVAPAIAPTSFAFRWSRGGFPAAVMLASVSAMAFASALLPSGRLLAVVLLVLFVVLFASLGVHTLVGLTGRPRRLVPEAMRERAHAKTRIPGDDSRGSS